MRKYSTLSKNIPREKLIIYGFFFVILTLVILKIPFVFNNPLFSGDSGHRMNNANKIIFLVGNRVWLPFLQSQIFIFHRLKVPYFMFKFIPWFYFLIALIFLSKIAYKHLADKQGGLVFCLLVLIGFSYQPFIIFLSVNLYQEIIGIAFFYILLQMGALELRKSKLLFLLGCVALFVREDFWIYLFVLSLINFRKIIKDTVYLCTFAKLWVIPFFWLVGKPFLLFFRKARWPDFPVEWPLMINSKLAFSSHEIYKSFGNYKAAISKTNLYLLLLAVFFISLLVVFAKNGKTKEVCVADVSGRRFKIFSLASLSIIYFLIVLCNPWECTPGNPRIAVPLLTHLVIWAILCYRESFIFKKHLSILARVILIIGMFSIIDKQAGHWFCGDYSEVKYAHSKINELIKAAGNDSKLRIGIVGDYWRAVGYFIAPTLYIERSFIPAQPYRDTDDYDILIAPSGFRISGKSFLKDSEFIIEAESYSIYTKSAVR